MRLVFLDLYGIGDDMIDVCMGGALKEKRRKSKCLPARSAVTMSTPITTFRIKMEYYSARVDVSFCGKRTTRKKPLIGKIKGQFS
jgi:hypothetical protein